MGRSTGQRGRLGFDLFVETILGALRGSSGSITPGQGLRNRSARAISGLVGGFLFVVSVNFCHAGGKKRGRNVTMTLRDQGNRARWCGIWLGCLFLNWTLLLSFFFAVGVGATGGSRKRRKECTVSPPPPVCLEGDLVRHHPPGLTLRTAWRAS
jgi:hypothetical protein